jgi:hypothetical protein
VNRVGLVGLSAVVLSLPLLCGCGADTPTKPEIAKIHLEPSQVEQYEADSVRFSCGAWHPLPPSQDRGLFDVYYGPHGSETADWQLAEIRSNGGTVAHEFNVDVIRAVLDTKAVSRLAGQTRGVPDAYSFLVCVSVAFRREVTEADLQALQSAGAIFITVGSQSVVANVPDPAIPSIRAMSQVSSVVACWSGSCPD